MTRYYFHVKGEQPFIDDEGLDLPGIEAARAEAEGFVRDCKRTGLLARKWPGWSVSVTDENGTAVLEVAFEA